MAEPLPTIPNNHLLRLAERDDLAALSAHFEPIALSRGDVLIRAHRPIESVVFPEEGIASIVSITEDGRRIEIGIVGREGFTDGSLQFGIDRVPYETFVQMPGKGLRIAADAFVSVVRERPALSQLLSRFNHVFSVQTGQSALANASYTLEERLARWLLMCQDRVGGGDLHITHEFIGMMLAVRRSGVTLALQLLEGSKVIEARRGHITILDREALIGIAGSSYGVAEAEYERVLGPMGR